MKISRIIAMLLCTSLVLTMSACGSKRELKREETKLKEYLKAKYNDEFVINKLDYYIPQIGSLMIKGTASPKDNKDIIFQIVSSSLDTDLSDKFGDDFRDNTHYDNYLSFIWDNKEYQDYIDDVKKVFHEHIESIEIDIDITGDANGDMIIGYTPDYEIMKEDYRKYMTLHVVIRKKCIPYVQIEEAKSMLKLVEHLKKSDLNHYKLTLYCVSGKKTYLFRIWKDNEDIQRIVSIEDVMKDMIIIDDEE